MNEVLLVLNLTYLLNPALCCSLSQRGCPDKLGLSLRFSRGGLKSIKFVRWDAKALRKKPKKDEKRQEKTKKVPDLT